MSLKAMKKEQADMEIDPVPDCYAAGPVGEDLFHWKGMIVGPDETPYARGIFFLDIHFPSDYPFRPPKIKFDTKIFHSNVQQKTGGIAVDIFTEWSPAWRIDRVLLAIRSILADPLHPAINLDAYKLYRENRPEHDRIAREWTLEYAT